jgi:hypothetical protein
LARECAEVSQSNSVWGNRICCMWPCLHTLCLPLLLEIAGCQWRSVAGMAAGALVVVRCGTQSEWTLPCTSQLLVALPLLLPPCLGTLD